MSPCYLNTHRQYTKTFRKAKLLRTTAVGVHVQSRTGTPSDHSRSSAQISVRTTSNPEVVFDSLPELPFERPYPKEFPEILHFFVTVTLDRLLLLFRPSWKLQIYKKSVIQQLLSDNLFATMCIANGKFEMLMYSGCRSSEVGQVASIIYGRITKMIRTRLDDLQTSEIDALLLCVGALANFDSLSMKKDVLDKHRSATHQLVAAKGGVHNLDCSLPYVMQSDMKMAVVTGTLPVFSKTNRNLLPLIRRPPLHYGTAFNAASLFEADVLLFCQETCHLLDLFERAGITYDITSHGQGDQKLLPYFLFSRDQLGTEFAELHARYLQEAGKDWCMLVAAKIVEYPIVHGNYTLLFTEYLVRELSDTLKKQEWSANWQGTGKALIWVLWTLATAPVAPEITSWAEKMLVEALESKYGEQRSDWAIDWAAKEWDLCMQYVWSREHLRSSFDILIGRLSSSIEVE